MRISLGDKSPISFFLFFMVTSGLRLIELAMKGNGLAGLVNEWQTTGTFHAYAIWPPCLWKNYER